MRPSSRLLRLAMVAAITVVITISWSNGPSLTSAEDEPPQTVPDQPTGLAAESGDTQVRLTWDDPDADSPSITGYEFWRQARGGKLIADDDGNEDQLGSSVAVVGDTAVVGMPGDDDTVNNSGAVLVFTWDADSGAWTETAKLKASDAAPGDRFGTSVAFDGATVVVGAPDDDHIDDGNTIVDAGSVYVFIMPAGGWVSTSTAAKLKSSDAARDDSFGKSVAFDGTTVVVGAPDDDHTDDGNTIVDAGSAYVFTMPAGGWVATSTAAKLKASDAAGDDGFGNSVGVDGATIVVGAPADDHTDDDDNNIADAGSVYVFTRPGTGWASTSAAAKLTASTRGEQDEFGHSVAVDDDTVVVGALGTKTTVGIHQLGTGAAFVFTRPAGGWTATSTAARLTASVRAAGDKFGYSVAVDGDTVVVGANGDNQGGGIAYVFPKPTSGWADGVEEAELIASDRAADDKFGSSVTVDGDTVVVGAPYENHNTFSNAGAAYVFDVPGWREIAGSGATTTSHIVTGLRNNINHTFRVRAVNAAGASGPSGSVLGRPTEASYAPVIPRNFSAAQIDIGQVELTWDASTDPLTVTGYEYIQGNGSNWTPISGSDYSTRSHAVAGLSVGTTHSFAVRALNSAGQGRRSYFQSVTIVAMPAVPSGFAAEAGDTQVRLTWKNPGDPSTTQYQYRQQEGEGDVGIWIDVPGSGAKITSHIVTGLANDSEYSFRIRAVNAAFDGTPSDHMTATPTAASVPPASPVDLTAEQNGIDQVELRWDASSDPLTVTGYDYSRDAGTNWTAIPGSDYSTISHTVTGLVTGTRYTFAVRAKNGAGEGTRSQYRSATIVAKPAEPGNFAAMSGDTQVRLTWDDPDADSPSIRGYEFWRHAQTKKLTAASGVNEDNLGSSVAVVGDTAVVGMPGDDDTVNNSGAVLVFTRDPVSGVWTETAKLKASDAARNDRFGKSVAFDGATVVVGTPDDDHDGGSNAGSAYVFTMPAGGWVSTSTAAKLTAYDGEAGDKFGFSVAVDGDTVVVGAYGRNTSTGAAYVFTKPETGWTTTSNERAILSASAGADDDEFGSSVAIDGDTIVVGARGDDSNSGAAYVFTRPGTGWASTSAAAKLTVSDGADNDEFGSSVAVDGDTIVVGVHQDDDGGSNSGAAYVFTRPDGGWTATSSAARLTASDGAANDKFGSSVAVDGDTVVVGANGDNQGAGTAYIFARPASGWADGVEEARVLAADGAANDKFGSSVTVDGDTVVVGAPNEDHDGIDHAGAAYVFDVPGWREIAGSGATTTSHTVTGLSNAVTHTFRVRAVNAAGASDPSDTTLEYPAAASDPPVIPRNFSAAQVDIGRVELTWDPHPYPLTVTGYEYSLDGGSDWTAIEGSDYGTDSHTVHNLTEGTYTFAVRAVNSIGESTPASAQSVTVVAKPATPSGFAAKRGDTQVRLTWDAPGAELPIIANYQLWQIAESETLTTGTGGEFGYSVAVVGDIAVVGMPDDADSGGDSGAAFVFSRVDGVWTQKYKLKASDAAQDAQFGNSVAFDGETIMVGAPFDNDQSGAAYLFTEPTSEGGWANPGGTETVDLNETSKLTASDAEEGDEFAWNAVAVDGDTVVVGANQDNDVRGAAYVFTKPGTGWTATTTQTAMLTAEGAGPGDEFGSSVAIDGDVIVVGASGDDGTDWGSAFVFEKPEGGWASTSAAAKLTSATRRDNDNFGRSVAIDGGTIVVGASGDDGTYMGSAFVFVEPTEGWATSTQTAKLTASDGAAGDRFGYSVAVDGDTVVVGAYGDDVDGTDSGSAYVFTKRDSGWVDGNEAAKLNPSDGSENHKFGSSVAIDGDTIVVGAENNNATDMDTAYVFDIVDWDDIAGAGATSHIVTGLSNKISHTFRVRAVNAAGASAPSDSAVETPKKADSAPAKPTNFSAEQNGVDQVELTWDAHPYPLTVTGYEYSQDGGSSWTAIAGSDYRTISHSVTGLATSTTYTFAVRAVNGEGHGPSSDSDAVTLVARPEAPGEFAAEAGDTQVRLTWSGPGTASITRYQVSQLAKRLISYDRSAEDELGWSVAIDGDTLVIGALGDDPDNTGAAYVFTRGAGGWTEAGKLTAEDRKLDAGFGRAVAVHGDAIVVGAYQEDHGMQSDAGAAYVFTRPATGWTDMTQTARLTAYEDEGENPAGDEFGSSVAVHEDTIVVGAPEDGSAKGAAYIFTRPNNGWTSTSTAAKLAGQTGGDRFGRSVAVYRDTVVVGAPEQGDDAQGRAYVFTKSAATGVWDDWDGKYARDATARLQAPNRGNGDRFGRAVALEDDTIVVGAPYRDGPSNSGSAYVFTRSGGGWASTSTAAKLTASDAADNDEFGLSVAVDGDTVVVGARQTDHTNEDGEDVNNSGSAYVFAKPDTGWTSTTTAKKLTAYDASGNDLFGHSVAADGGAIVVGAPYGDYTDDDGNAVVVAGSAYVFGTEAEWADIPGSGAGTTSHIATRLPNQAEHTFRVRAVNAAGAGAPAPFVALEDTPTAASLAPARPRNFSAEQSGVGQVELTWDAHLYPLTVAGYQFSQDGGTSWADIKRSDSGTVSHTVDDLTEGTTYTFAVRAVNGAGSTPSDSRPVTIIGKSAPPDLLDMEAGDTQVRLSWKNPGESEHNQVPVPAAGRRRRRWQLDRRPRERSRDHVPHRDRPE